jgi:selenoprotein W-related protein
LSQSADSESETTRISIEYCTGCRWMLKSFWMAQELLTTFEDEVDAITIVPSRTTNGVFAVRLNGDSLLWDRKEKGGFPTPKGLKQIVRDMVAPELNLGHSDTEARQAEKKESEEKETAREEVEIDIKLAESEAPQPTVTIHYCTGCRWLLRAAYFGQELLTTFDKEINSVTLMPSKPPDKGGRFVSLFVFAVLLQQYTTLF